MSLFSYLHKTPLFNYLYDSSTEVLLYVFMQLPLFAFSYQNSDSLCKWHTFFEHLYVHNHIPVCSRGCLFQCVWKTHSTLSDHTQWLSVVYSMVFLLIISSQTGLPGCSSNWLWWSLLRALRALWANNLKWRSITMFERGRHPMLPWPQHSNWNIDCCDSVAVPFLSLPKGGMYFNGIFAFLEYRLRLKHPPVNCVW